MKHLSVLALALAVLTAGCSKNSSTAPTNTTTTNIFTASLSPANEVPPITNAEASGTGSATITMLSTKDSAGNIAGATMTFAVTMSNFPPGTPINIAHIHPGAAGVNGSVLVSTTLAAGEVVLTNGSGSFTKSSIAVDAAQAQAILNNPAGYYFNIHTTLNAGGVARGQLVKTQ